jgi:hypothetical protein
MATAAPMSVRWLKACGAPQPAHDGVDRARDALVGGGQEPDEGDVEHARVELLRAVVLGEGPLLGVGAIRAVIIAVALIIWLAL